MSREGLPSVRVPESVADPVETVLRRGRAALLAHPDATRAAFLALIEEGRRHAATPAGARERRRLCASALAHRARFAWELTSLQTFADDSGAVTPSRFADALMLLADSDELETVMERLYGGPDDLG